MTYEFRCDRCGQRFEVRATVAEKTKGLDLKCPACGSSAATQVYTSIAVFSGGGASRGPTGCGGGPQTGCCG